MRIRKHARVSPLNHSPNPSSAAPAAVPLTTVCQLNQSPWDAMTFPPEENDNDDTARLPPSPPPFLVDREYYRSSCIPNRTFANQNAAGESALKKEKREDVIPVAAAVVVGKVNDYPRSKEESDSLMIGIEEKEVILCTKTDKKGWQCGRRVKNGNSFCDKHLPKGKNIHKNNSAGAHSKKPAPAPAENNPRRATRPRKPASASSNPYEFYYYSGFGPRWGKRRRGENCISTVSDAEGKQETNSSLENGSGSDTSSASRNLSVITEDAAENGRPKLSSNSDGTDKNSVFSQFKRNGLDYVEDSDDDMEEDFDDDDDYEDDEDGEKIGTKRARSRKPIKARSLKSLM